ncbi:hypothetical protein L1286_23910 [Pseudoalteromonas sp. SMS1]|uniref:hypothetical protein n=1 Tax=Pseudoalteromonas sp. SMS1 TaxID=2908894 RepID=UPI001F1EF5CF|nr:hypothetical protein [Pseudoalteromonas sp. SMS1]MCF2860512.1 hypothetical protein [Pseudoalteromonas sp. SMS1]
MYLNENEFPEPMKLVYEVKKEIESEPEVVRLTQSLTLDNSKPYDGLNGSYGLYGSEEWFENLNSGVIPRKEISGVIEKVYSIGMDEEDGPNTIDIILDDNWETIREGIYINNQTDVELFKVGRRVVVLYFIEELKLPSDTPSGKKQQEFVLEMAVSTE